MKSTTLAASGTFPSLCWHPALRQWLAVWQDGAHLLFNNTDFKPIDVKGGQTSYARLCEFGGSIWLTAREGTEEGLGFLWKFAGYLPEVRRELGRAHGMYPTVMGEGSVAWLRAGATAGWPIFKAPMVGAAMPEPAGLGAPTGLALITQGMVVNWDQLRGVVPGLNDPTFAGWLVAGTTDRNGKPCVVVTHPESGRELVLWPGQDSLNPVIAWDGGEKYAVVAWSGRGEGIRLAEFIESELLLPMPEPGPDPEPEPEPEPQPEPEPEPEPEPGGDDMTAEDIRRYVAALPNNVLFGAFQRFHNEVLPRDRPKDGAIKSEAWTEGDPDFWTGDVTTGGAMGIFTRTYMPELLIAMDSGRTADEASGDAYDKGIAAYKKATGQNPQ
jgi:hypothetical protein